MLKFNGLELVRDANNYQQEKNTPIWWDNSLFHAVFSCTEHFYCENIA